MRHRHAYAATDNIILDFQSVDSAGSAHLMGDVLTASRALRLRVKVGGTHVLTHVELIRNGAVIYSIADVGKRDAEFEFRDTAPVQGKWSFPIWVTYQ